MRRSWVFAILRPEFTWPRPMAPSICRITPEVPSIPGRWSLRAVGLFHSALYRLSEWYCDWFEIRFDVNIVQLPFGLVLKWTGRTSFEEAAAMEMARAAGMPVPRVLSVGVHPNSPHTRYFSILMTRLPGFSLDNSFDLFDIDWENPEEPFLRELRDCITAMRTWHSPYAQSICSALGTSIRSSRVPGHVMGPFTDPDEFHDFLLAPASAHGFDSMEEYSKTLKLANELRNYHHRLTFSHGDLKAHNILIDDDGHLSGFLDWESAGWHPEYWDFTMRFGRSSWWFQALSWMGGNQYRKELECDIAINALTVDSYIHF